MDPVRPLMDRTAREDLYRLAALLAEIERVMDPLAASDSTEFRVDPMPPPPLPPTGTAGGGALGGGSTARSAQEWLSIGGREPTRRGAGSQLTEAADSLRAPPVTGPSGAGQTVPLTDTSSKVPPSGARPRVPEPVRMPRRPVSRGPIVDGKEVRVSSTAGPLHAGASRPEDGQDRPPTVWLDRQDGRVPAPEQWREHSTRAEPRHPLFPLDQGPDRSPESRKPGTSFAGTTPGIGPSLHPPPFSLGVSPPTDRLPTHLSEHGSDASLSHRRPPARRRSLRQAGEQGLRSIPPDLLDGLMVDGQLHAPSRGLVDIRIPHPGTGRGGPPVNPTSTKTDRRSHSSRVETEADVQRMDASGPDLEESEIEATWDGNDPFDLLDLSRGRDGWGDGIRLRGLSAGARERIARRLRGRFLDRTLRRLP